MFDVTCIGEALIDFSFLGISDNNMELFERSPGGAPANVACAVSKLGLKTAFIGKVGADMHGEFLISVLRECGVDTSGMVIDPSVFTTLAFVKVSENGERSFSFARKPGADTQLEIHELNMYIITNSYIFHMGSLSLTDEPARSATIYAAQKAKAAHSIIAYDPNYRESLWESPEEARRQIRSVFPYVDAIKISDEETALLTGYEDPERASLEIMSQGIPLVIVTMGAKGAFIRTESGSALIRGNHVDVVDTTGAGDAFWGGFLYQIAQTKVHPKNLPLDMAKMFAGFAIRVAEISIGRRGAIHAMPYLSEVQL